MLLAASSTAWIAVHVCSPDDKRNQRYWLHQQKRAYALSTAHCADNTDGSRYSRNNSIDTKSKLIFLGSGSSTGCPRPLCALLFGDADQQADTGTPVASSTAVETMSGELAHKCRTSIEAIRGGDPRTNPNYRNNPSLLLSVVSPVDGERRNVVIDVGKTFREGALRWFPTLGIQSIDSIILTHEHMDAAGGLDDVRGFQHYVRRTTTNETVASAHFPFRQVPMPLFLSQHCLAAVQAQFPWLIPKEQEAKKGNVASVKRHVASFDVTVFEPYQAFEALPGFYVTPLPVMHGEDLVSYGFCFTLGGRDSGEDACNVVYLSDISRMLPETMEYIQERFASQPIHILVVDALTPSTPNPVHFHLEQAMAQVVSILQPCRTYLVGMNCDGFPPHAKANEQLLKRSAQLENGKTVQMAHDGLVIELPLNGADSVVSAAVR